MVHVVDPTLRPLHADIYAAIREAWVDYGRAPSQMEIRDATLCSITTVVQGIKELKRRGYITAPKHMVRSMKPTDLDRTISCEPLPPWAELEPPRKFFRIEKRRTNR